jgi:hypothetical protein
MRHAPRNLLVATLAPILAALLSTTTAAAPVVSAAVETGPLPGSRHYLALPLDATDEPAQVPYVWERRAGGKHLVVIGTKHSRDPASPMFARIEAIAARVRPQIVLHESAAPPGLETLARDEAIAVGADVGFAVHLAAAHDAVLRSGDAPEREEFAALLAAYPAQEVLVFLTAQRLIGNDEPPDLDAAAAHYPAFFADYLAANGIPRREGWDTGAGWLREYERVVGSALTPATWRAERLSAVRDAGKLSDMARATNAVRDRSLLAAIDRALREHDRVLVVFGSWHVLALEPVLEGALDRSYP